MSFRRQLALWLAVLAPLGATATPPAVTIEIRPLGGQQWQADYQWAEPVQALRFLHAGQQLRPGRWALQTPGTRLEPMGRTARIVREDGRTFDSISLIFEEDRRQVDTGYPLFQGFSDGGLLLNTAYLVARPMRRADDRASGLPGHLEFVIHPRPGEIVAAGGQHADQPIRLRHTRGGSWVYLGAVQPRVVGQAMAIVDPGAPAWVRNTAATVLPASIGWLAEALGTAPAQRPSLLLTADPDGEAGVGGGVRDAQVHIALSGPDWAERTDERHARLVRLIAHESAHLWNSRMARNRDHRRHRWLHEGSADALADAAIAALELLPAERIRRFREDALNDCIQELGSDSLAAQTQRRRYGAHYDCGSSFERLVAAHSGPGALWRQVLARAAAGDGRYGLDSYLDSVVLVANRPALADFGRQLAEQGFAQPARRFQDELRAAGIPHVVDAGTPAPAEQVRLVQIALAHLVQADCKRQIPVKNHTTYYQVSGQAGCLALRPSQTLRIRTVSGHGVGTDGAAAYDAVVAACTGGDPVLLGDGERSWPVPCSQPLPARPPRIRLLPAG